MLDFLVELVGEALVQVVLTGVGMLLKLLFYGPLVFIGWLGLSWLQRHEANSGPVWQQYSLAALHQAGYQYLALAAQYIAAVVITLPLLLLLFWAVCQAFR